MKAKKNNCVFICQVSDNSLKVIKYLGYGSSRKEVAGSGLELIPANIDDKQLFEKLQQILKKLGYDSEPLIISLMRAQATCRYLKIPAQNEVEVEKIAFLQAPRYLPYPPEELISASQITSIDKEGYSNVNLCIVHKDTIGRYLKIFKELKAAKISIVLSSYGLSNLYNYLKPDKSNTALVVDVDYQQAELAVISAKKLLFSRSFKLARTNPGWKNALIDEINKTLDAYYKDISAQMPEKIFIVGAGKIMEGFPELNERLTVPVEVLSYKEKINSSPEATASIFNSEYSFASVIGMGLESLEDSLNLLPLEMKAGLAKAARGKVRLRTAIFISAIFLTWAFGIIKDADNKQEYLKRLKIELNNVAKDAKPVEDIQKRLELAANRLIKRPTGLDMLYELNQIMLPSINLSGFNYEEGKEASLRGQTQELNAVFTLVEQLEKSPVFKNFSVKVRYATGKKIQAGEIIDFEIYCLKK